MFRFGGATENAPHVLREIVSVERSLRTGGTRVDKAIALWFDWQPEVGILPDWSSFKPFEHPDLLAHVSVSKQQGEHYLCVLVGEAVRVQLPVKVEGKLIHEAMPAVNAVDVIKRSDLALEQGLPNYVEKTLAWNPGHDYVRYRALYLPFASAQDGNSRILTVFDFETKVA